MDNKKLKKKKRKQKQIVCITNTLAPFSLYAFTHFSAYPNFPGGTHFNNLIFFRLFLIYCMCEQESNTHINNRAVGTWNEQNCYLLLHQNTNNHTFIIFHSLLYVLYCVYIFKMYKIYHRSQLNQLIFIVHTLLCLHVLHFIFNIT